jgi:hypothetical protein
LRGTGARYSATPFCMQSSQTRRHVADFWMIEPVMVCHDPRDVKPVYSSLNDGDKAVDDVVYFNGRYSIRFAISSGAKTWQTTSRSSTYLPMVAAS